MLEPRTLLERLLEAESEADVHSVLGDAKLLDDGLWHPYGNQTNNAGTFLSQQADARGAIVEKIVNSIDAVLMRHAHEHGDIQSGDLPESMFKAAERYFGIRDGKLHNITAGERGRLAAQSVQVVFTGSRSRPTITIIDQGEGQSPDRFPDTFLSLSADNKRTIPFVQGKFNMGSAGAVPFCGTEHHYQLILSRRSPAASGADGQWGFTVVRRRRPDTNEKTSIFQYLAPDGAVPSFEAEALPLWVRGSGADELAYGSLVRLYEYAIPDSGTARLDFSHMLHRRLYRLAVPVSVIERRYPGREGRATVAGLEARLVDKEAGMIEEGWPQGGERKVDGVGTIRMTITPFESEPAGRWLRASESVIFTINGQAHAFEPRQFLRRGGATGPNLAWLANTLLVEVDCSLFEPRVVEQLFMGSRDRMRDNEQRQALLAAVSEYLREHRGLRALNERRRQEAMRQQDREDPRDAELFGRLSSEITKFLRGTRGVVGGNGAEPDGAFDGKRFPTYLRWEHRGDGEEIEKHCPQNGVCVVNLVTDAENGFLTRPDDYGECHVEPDGWFVSHTLSDGDLRIRLRAPENAVAGDRVPLVVRLICEESLVQELVAEGYLIVDPAENRPNPGPKPNPNPHPRRGAVAPNPVRVYRGQPTWERLGFDESTVAKINTSADTTFAYVNMDNASLHRYRRGQPRRAEEINSLYLLAAAAIALAADTAVNAGDVEEDAADKVLGIVGRVLAPTLDFVNQNSFAPPEDED